MTKQKTNLTPKNKAVVVKKIKTSVKSAETMMLHNLAALRGILKEDDTQDMDVSKLEARVAKVLTAMQEDEYD